MMDLDFWAFFGGKLLPHNQTYAVTVEKIIAVCPCKSNPDQTAFIDSTVRGSVAPSTQIHVV